MPRTSRSAGPASLRFSFDTDSRRPTLMSSRPRVLAACLSACLSFSTALLSAGDAKAEKILVKNEKDKWEVYTEGRVGTFLSYVVGDAAPIATLQITRPDGSVVPEVIPGGGWSLTAENKDETTQGTVNMMRVR